MSSVPSKFASAPTRRSPSLLRNGIYNAGGQAVRGTVGILTIPFLIRLLGIREYGVWSLAYAVLALMIMTEAGFSVAVTVFLSKDLAKNDVTEASKTLSFVSISAIVLSLMLALILWFAGPQIVHLLGAFGSVERADAGRALQIVGLAVVAMILQRTLIGVEQAFDRYATINILDLLQSLLANVGIVVVAWLGGKTVAMMKWQVLAYAAVLVAHSVVVYYLLCGKGFGFVWSGTKAMQISRYGAAAWTSTLGSVTFGQCDRMIVGAFLGAPTLGIYSAITGLTSKINSFSGTAVQPLVPSLSGDVTSISVERRIRQAVQLNALIALQSGIVLYVLADWVVRIIIPGAGEPSVILGLQVTAIIYALYSLNAPGHFILFALGQPRTNALVTVCGALVSLTLIFLGARYLGLLGALVGNAGYLFLFALTVLGLKSAHVPLRQYAAWMVLPLAGLVVALVIGLLLQYHFWWRAAFVILQGSAFSLWFLFGNSRRGWIRFSFGSVPQS